LIFASPQGNAGLGFISFYRQNMKRPKLTRGVLLTLSGILFSSGIFAQGAWEVNMVQSTNPRYLRNESWKTLSSTAKPLAVTVPFCMIAAALITDNKALEENAYEVTAGLVISSILAEGLKKIVNRPRPYQTHPDIYPDEWDDSPSFPSGHTAAAFSVATSLTLTTKKWYIAVPAYAWAGAVGYSRLYLGQHYPSDLIAGAITGAAGAYAAHWLNKKIFGPKKNQTPRNLF
jgi:membrane-associated phospholipid phosphatase